MTTLVTDGEKVLAVLKALMPASFWDNFPYDLVPRHPIYESLVEIATIGSAKLEVWANDLAPFVGLAPELATLQADLLAEKADLDAGLLPEPAGSEVLKIAITKSLPRIRTEIAALTPTPDTTPPTRALIEHLSTLPAQQTVAQLQAQLAAAQQVLADAQAAVLSKYTDVPPEDAQGLQAGPDIPGVPA